VPEHDDERDRGDDRRHRGGEDDLADGRAAGWVGLLAALALGHGRRRDGQHGDGRQQQRCQSNRHLKIPSRKLPPVSYGG
jgi:hypothetical protein